MHIIMILIGLAIAYASYLHYHDHLIPKQRGRHYEGTRVYEYTNVASNLFYMRGDIDTGTWKTVTGRS
jgi:hypothetical protein